MRRIASIVQLRTLSGKPVTVGEVTITPRSQALVLQLPFLRLVWNRPVAVLLEQGGRTERVPIVDVTRAVQLGLLALPLLLSMPLWIKSLVRR